VVTQDRTAALEAALSSIEAAYFPAALASSLSAEDMVITDAIARGGLGIGVFVLDTGRLHRDTLELIERVEDRYGFEIKVWNPQPDAVAEFVAVHGRDAFYEGVAQRKRCCEIRKVEPLRRALAGKRAWLTGQRREQAVTRGALLLQQHDAVHAIEKFNPLAEWTERDVWAYIRKHEVPYNTLYDQGYRSIGCAPCTRPVVTGEDARAGRWWWEQPETKECGLHVSPDGHLVRAREAVQ